MTRVAAVRGLTIRAVAFGTTVLVLAWLLGHVMPHPFSGFLALALAGAVALQLIKRQPHQQASRAFRHYLRGRAGGADEATARERMLARMRWSTPAREQWARHLAAGWTGDSEKARVVGGVAAALTAAGQPVDPSRLSDVWDRARDRFRIAGWEALPPEFVAVLLQPLDERQRADLQLLAGRYHLFEQKFFRSPSALGRDPATGVEDFARLLNSLGNRVSQDAPGDAERAYRLAVRLRADTNLAHAGLALVLARTGRTREAAQEAQQGLAVLDELAARGARGDAPTTEDITPFRTPTALRDALTGIVTAGKAP